MIPARLPTFTCSIFTVHVCMEVHDVYYGGLVKALHKNQNVVLLVWTYRSKSVHHSLSKQSSCQSLLLSHHYLCLISQIVTACFAPSSQQSVILSSASGLSSECSQSCWLFIHHVHAPEQEPRVRAAFALSCHDCTFWTFIHSFIQSYIGK